MLIILQYFVISCIDDALRLAIHGMIYWHTFTDHALCKHHYWEEEKNPKKKNQQKTKKELMKLIAINCHNIIWV